MLYCSVIADKLFQCIEVFFMWAHVCVLYSLYSLFVCWCCCLNLYWLRGLWKHKWFRFFSLSPSFQWPAFWKWSIKRASYCFFFVFNAANYSHWLSTFIHAIDFFCRLLCVCARARVIECVYVIEFVFGSFFVA